MTFVSKVFEGSISDQAIIEQSGFLECLEHGDSVMADKGVVKPHSILNHN